MKRLAQIAAAAAILLGAGTVAASAACNGGTSTETVLGAGSGALVGDWPRTRSWVPPSAAWPAA